MSMSLAQLWQVVADAKNDLHVVERELAELIDAEEKRKDKLPVYDNFLPVGTYLLSEEEHRMAPIGTRISEKDLRDGKMASLVWEKVGPNHWRVVRPGWAPAYTDAEIADSGTNYVNVVVEQETAKLAGEKEKQQGEQSLPVGTKLITHEDHEKAPIGTLIREYNTDTKAFGTWSWRKVGPSEWAEYDPYGDLGNMLTTAHVAQVLRQIVNTVVDS